MYNVKVMFHSCGSIIDFIDDIIEIGVDILDPIQTSAKDMDPQYIKQRFGEKICLHGSIDYTIYHYLRAVFKKLKMRL